jgi:hypothetical protein
MWGRGAWASWAAQPGVPGFTDRKVTEAVPRETQRELRGQQPPSLGGALSSPAPGSHPVRGPLEPQRHPRAPHGSQLRPGRNRRRSRLNAHGAPGAPEASLLRALRPLRPRPGAAPPPPAPPPGLAQDLPPARPPALRQELRAGLAAALE